LTLSHQLEKIIENIIYDRNLITSKETIYDRFTLVGKENNIANVLCDSGSDEVLIPDLHPHEFSSLSILTNCLSVTIY